MDSQTLITIMWTIVGAVATTFLGLIAWGLKKMIMTTFENTVQIKLLTEKLDTLLKLPPRMEKVEKDITEAHNRIRSLKNGGTL